MEKREKEERKLMFDEIQRLKLSSSARVRDLEFDKATCWKLNDIELFLGRSELPLLDASLLSDCIERVVEANSEPQSEWNSLLTFLGCNVCDTHAVNNSLVNLTDRDGTKHYPDFSFVVGSTVLWERLVWVAELKKDLTDAKWRDAVVQVFSRLFELFDHQSERVVVPSIVLDKKSVSFVRVERNAHRELQLFVSERLQLFKNVDGAWSFSEHGELLRRFLSLSPSQCGYVNVVMPIFLGKKMQSILRPGLTTCVYVGEDGHVYKKGPRVAHEAAMLRLVEKLVPSVCPEVLTFEGDVLCMPAGMDVRGVFNEVDVAVLASQLFWHVYQVHECGLVHGDIKPGNVLRMCAVPQKYVLCDWDSATDQQADVDVERRCTAGFCEPGPLNCVTPEDFDLLGVYWTVAYVLASKTQGSRIGASAWLKDQIKWMSPPPGALPQIQWFLRDQFHNGLRLTHPRELVDQFYAISGAKNCEEWIFEVRKLELRSRWPVCPQQLLEQLWKKVSENGGVQQP